jgi:hypothetical protein
VDGASRLARAGAEVATLARQPALWAGAICLAGVGVAVEATRATGSASGSPIYPPGFWHSAWIAALVVAFAAYAIGLVLLARGPARAGLVLFLVAAIQLTPLAGPLLLSADPLIYNGLGTVPHPFESRPGFGGGETYGPLWQLISQPLARLDGGLSDTSAYAFRLLAAACVLGIVALVWRLARRKILAAAFVGWNPFIALHFAGGGHNDALMMVFVLGALAFASSNRPDSGGASWVTAAALKWTAAWFFVLWTIERAGQRRPLGIVGIAVASSLLLALAFGVYGTAWLHALHNLSQQERLDHPSLGMLGWLEDAGLSRHASIVADTAAQVAALGVFARLAWKRRLHLGLAAGFLVVLAPRLDPWYALWPISLAAADDDDRWGRVLAVVLSGVLLSDAASHFIEA